MKRPVTLPVIERFLRLTGWGPSRFGRAAVNDANLVADLRSGKTELGPKREAAVASLIEDHVAKVQDQARKMKDLLK